MIEQPGQHDNKGQLGDLTGLKAKGDPRQIDPTLVTCVPGLTERIDEQDDEQAQHKENLPPFFHQEFHIHKGGNEIHHHTHGDEHSLPNRIAS